MADKGFDMIATHAASVLEWIHATAKNDVERRQMTRGMYYTLYGEDIDDGRFW